MRNKINTYIFLYIQYRYTNLMCVCGCVCLHSIIKYCILYTIGNSNFNYKEKKIYNFFSLYQYVNYFIDLLINHLKLHFIIFCNNSQNENIIKYGNGFWLWYNNRDKYIFRFKYFNIRKLYFYNSKLNIIFK